MLRLRLLGGVVIERSGLQVTETAELHKALALLALVAASGDRGITRDELAAYLWPESAGAQARAALSQTLYTLRKQLAEPELFVGTRTLRLNSSLIGVDLHDFEQALNRDDLEAAVDLYSGAFLQGLFVANCVELERWIESKRSDIAQQWSSAVESLGSQASERGDFASAARWWRRLTAAEPGNSRAVAAFLTALVATGDRAGALQAAQSHEAFLRSEFDAPPDPAVTEIVHQIRQGREPPRAETNLDPRSPADAAHHTHIEAASDERLTQPPPVMTGLARLGSRSRVALLATVVGALAAAIVITGRVTGRPDSNDSLAFSERRVAVSSFRNETGDSALASVGRLAVDWVLLGLAQTQLVEVVAPGVQEAGIPTPRGTARTPNAGLVVRGSYSLAGDSLVMQAQIVEAATGRVIRAVGPVSGPRREPSVSIERLRQRLAGALASRIDPRLSRWSDAASQPTSFEAYRAFDEGLTAFFSSRDDAGFARAGTQLVRAAAMDSMFNAPLVWAFYAFYDARDSLRRDSVLQSLESRRERLPRLDRALFDALVAFSRFDPVARYDAFRRVVAIAPNSEWVYKLADVAIELHRFGETDSLLKSLDPDGGWIRDWGMYWFMRAEIEYDRGEHEKELAVVTRPLGRNPTDVFDLVSAGRALAALGRKTELLALIDEAAHNGQINSVEWLRVLSAARVHGHADIVAEVAKRSLVRPVNELGVAQPRDRVRLELLIFEASSNWNAAVASAKALMRLDSLTRRHDALPYMVLLEAAVLGGVAQDTAGLEAKALAEAAARAESDGWSNWLSEQPIVVRAELAALHGDAQRTTIALREAVRRNFWDPRTEWVQSERLVFDRVRNDPLLVDLLHVPARDRPPTRLAR